MELKEEFRIPAPREAVFAALNDPEVLAAAIPGCESLEQISENAFKATVVSKIGPIKARFQGEVTLSDIAAPESYTISGEGKAGPAGFAKGSAKVHLTEDGGETVLSYEVSADVGGKIAQLGGRLIESTSKNLAGKFFKEFEAIVVARTSGEAPPESHGEEVAEFAPAFAFQKGIPGKGLWIAIAAGIALATYLLLK
ncbi:MAG: carbon monoxide dehydrogenase subunit G [Rhodospirillales bacterium]|nr:carbon monoxide dehydrogenase subunit G [Alphaproteobacteria bacterium]MBL6948741.1 carbon monoxide dehydrogenase subunit G [Rhodospirillales bacterium]